MTVRVASVVEGHGEVKALPILIRRIAERLGVYDCEIRTPHRIGRDHMTRSLVANAVRTQRDAVGEKGLIVVLYDSDDDTPDAVVESTKEQLAFASCEALVFVAVREYEAWLLAGVESLRESSAVIDDAAYEGDPEAPRDAAGRLGELMTESYRKTLHQPRFTAQFDIDLAAERSPSLRTFVDVVTEALRQAAG